MELILLERVENLGQMGDVVIVKPGYARNYLLPQKRALRATKQNLEQFQKQREQLETTNLERRGDAEKIAKKLEGQVVEILRNAGETGQLYGSVNARDIATAVTEAGFSIVRNQVVVQRATKVLGLHPIQIRLHPEVMVTIKANVARNTEEAVQQLKLGHAIVENDLEDSVEEFETDVAEIFEEGAAALNTLLESEIIEEADNNSETSVDTSKTEKAP